MRRVLAALLLLLVGSIAPAHAAVPPIVVIFMENKSYTQLEGFPAADRTYIDSFAAAGRRFSNYREGTSVGPSLPDYLGLAAGSPCGKTSDTTKAADPTVGSACPTTLWNQLDSAGVSWGVYEEGMPAPCSNAVNYKSFSTDGPYRIEHNPAVPFPSIYGHPTCAAHVLPFSSFDPANLPAVSFVAPNVCNDQHGTASPSFSNCVKNTDAIMKRGDAWLASHIPAMLAAGARVFLTYDEAGTMYAAERGPGIGSSVDATALTHYGLLRAIENLYGLACLNGACSATPVPLT